MPGLKSLSTVIFQILQHADKESAKHDTRAKVVCRALGIWEGMSENVVVVVDVVKGKGKGREMEKKVAEIRGLC